jgi:hypothetical protein
VEAERTIRLAIERGVPLDSDTILQLKARAARPSPSLLIVGGIILLSTAIGVAILAALLLFSGEEVADVYPLFGIAGLLACIGVGLLVGGVWLLRRIERGAA